MEDVMLGLRLAEGLRLDTLTPRAQGAAANAVSAGLLSSRAHTRGRAVLTLRGRLLADAVVRSLLP
jgi:oxygen-independent coproporphyrinogen-3 oxidase